MRRRDFIGAVGALGAGARLAFSTVTADAQKYEPTIRFRLPGQGPSRPDVPVDATTNAGQLIVELQGNVIQTVALTMPVLTIGRGPENGGLFSRAERGL